MVTFPKSVSILFLGIVLTASGCSRYETREDKQGRTIRVDHWTGEVTILVGDHMVKVKSQEEQEAEEKKRAAAVAALAAPKYMPAIPLGALGGGSATLMTSWRNDKIYYQFSLTPISKKVEQARSYGGYNNMFNLIFYDNAGFKLKEIEVRLYSMLGNVDDTGKVHSLSKDDSDFCSEDDYRNIATWNVSWHGFGPN